MLKTRVGQEKFEKWFLKLLSSEEGKIVASVGDINRRLNNGVRGDVSRHSVTRYLLKMVKKGLVKRKPVIDPETGKLVYKYNKST